MRRTRPVVAIDGPAGAGKTTVTRRVAERLGYTLVDTGALYRTVALAATRAGLSWADTAAVGELALGLAGRGAIRFDASPGGGGHVLLDGEDVSAAIRTQQVAEGASQVSAIPAVREALLELQRQAGRDGGVVLEGRDIGTVVFPDAEAKFFLTASTAVRAERRFVELRDKGAPADLARVTEEVRARDERDTMRPIAPLKQAEDAVLVDSSELDIEQVVERIVGHALGVAERLAQSSS